MNENNETICDLSLLETEMEFIIVSLEMRDYTHLNYCVSVKVKILNKTDINREICFLHSINVKKTNTLT